MKFLLFALGLILIIPGCGGGGVPTDYSGDEWGDEESTTAPATTGTPASSAETGVKQPSETASPTPETGGREFVPGRYTGELTPQLVADMREIRTKYKDWLKRSIAIIKQFQEGRGVNMANVKSIHDEGAVLSQKAQNIADELRKIDPRKYGHDIKSYTAVANDINHNCYILRDIMVGGK